MILSPPDVELEQLTFISAIFYKTWKASACKRFSPEKKFEVPHPASVSVIFQPYRHVTAHASVLCLMVTMQIHVDLQDIAALACYSVDHKTSSLVKFDIGLISPHAKKISLRQSQGMPILNTLICTDCKLQPLRHQQATMLVIRHKVHVLVVINLISNLSRCGYTARTSA